jgi:hypothetical protein
LKAILNKIGINKTHQRVNELYYGITQDNVEWILNRCTHCIETAANKSAPGVTPIISKGPLHKTYIDLMDFRSQRDSDFAWILQVKDHFSKFIWLFPLKDKASSSIAQEIHKWLGEHGPPKYLYVLKLFSILTLLFISISISYFYSYQIY